VALNSFPYFFKNSRLKKVDEGRDQPFLLPLIALITAGLFVQIFQASFDWLYPIPIFCSALIIFYYRSSFVSIIERSCFTAFLIGLFVFLIWIFLIPVDPTKSKHFFDEIERASLGNGILWLACRVMGAVLIVPIAEELAFRGLALPKLQAWLNDFFTRFFLNILSARSICFISLSLSLALTSILFGVLHSGILAGSLAGLGFGMAYLYRRKLIDAIVAHGVTNALLALYIIYFGYWSYW